MGWERARVRGFILEPCLIVKWGIFTRDVFAWANGRFLGDSFDQQGGDEGEEGEDGQGFYDEFERDLRMDESYESSRLMFHVLVLFKFSGYPVAKAIGCKMTESQ